MSGEGLYRPNSVGAPAPSPAAEPPTCQGLSQCVNALDRHDRLCPAAEPPEGLREAIGQAAINAMLYSRHQPNSGNQALDVADAVLTALAPLLAQAATDRAAVEAVEELIDPATGMATGNGYDRTRLFSERDIRRALSGDAR